MAGIDARIVIIGLPQVIHSIGADAEQGIWISQAYIMGTIGILLLTGRFADLYGRKRVYTSGFLIFTIGSILTSLSMNPIQLIIFRIIQGMGAGIILTSSIAIITDATPPYELGYSLGINNLGFRFGAMAGLTLSGIIISVLGDWRALFYINIPIGIIGTIWAYKTIKETTPRQNHQGKNKFLEIDWAGFTLFTISISTLLLALTFAAYGIGSQTLTALFVVISIVTFASFLFQEHRSQNPLVNFKLLKIREYTGGLVALLINGLAWGAVLVLLSFYFQLVLGLSPLDAGIRIIPFDLAFLIAGPISGKLSDRYGHLPFTTSGIALSSLSLWLFSTVSMTTSYLTVLVYMVQQPKHERSYDRVSRGRKRRGLSNPLNLPKRRLRSQSKPCNINYEPNHTVHPSHSSSRRIHHNTNHEQRIVPPKHKNNLPMASIRKRPSNNSFNPEKQNKEKLESKSIR